MNTENSLLPRFVSFIFGTIFRARVLLLSVTVPMVASCDCSYTISGRTFETTDRAKAGIMILPSQEVLRDEIDGIKPLPWVHISTTDGCYINSRDDGRFALVVLTTGPWLLPGGCERYVTVFASKRGYHYVCGKIYSGYRIKVVLLRKKHREQRKEKAIGGK